MTRLRLALPGALMLVAFAAHPAAADFGYEVEPGDTLSAIAATCDVSWQDLAIQNRIANPNRIQVGQVIEIPGRDSCVVEEEEPVEVAAAEAPPAEAEAAIEIPPAPPPSPGGAGFGYGVQVHASGGDAGRVVDMTRGMGFNWVKQQVEWRNHEGSRGAYNFGGIDSLVDAANGAGVNVLLSVVKAPDWARPGNTDHSVEGPPENPQDFANFMGAMAAHFRGRVKAYEIWNEQNLHYEWGNEPLSAARYMQLLRSVYSAVKANDPGAMVISGALTPTGVNDGSRAIDDVNYLAQMYANGLRGAADGVGAHPSGYNNPATVRAGWSDPAEPGFKGHRSFFFRSTMESYRNVMANYGDAGKKIWVTEFGWASTENLGAGPAGGYEYAGQNTEGEQAQYLVDAFNLARSWGYVGPMFVWNLNFAPVSGPGDEKAAFGLLRADWSPRPAYSALAGMGK